MFLISCLLYSPLVCSANDFFDDQVFSADFALWIRDRDRAGIDEAGKSTPKTTNLDHGSLFVSAGYSSGYYRGRIGFDLNAYATADLWNQGSPDHELNFWNVNNPYDKTPRDDGCKGSAWSKECTEAGGAIQTAALKFKFNDSLDASLGWIQPKKSTTLGVNWSFAAGTYRGAELGYQRDKLSLAMMVADRYRAPWYKRSYKFENTQGQDAGSIYSFGLGYAVNKNSLIETGYGQLTRGVRKNFHFKYKYSTDESKISPQLYFIKDSEKFTGTAYQMAVLAKRVFGKNEFRFESSYTSAPASALDYVGNFSYRLTDQVGGSNGNYELWWNNRSDFNHDNEVALFASWQRHYSEKTSFGISAAYGQGANIKQYDELKEYAFSLFASRKVTSGRFSGAKLSLHYTRFYNDSNAPNYVGYSNAFQDETDFKLIFTMPLYSSDRKTKP